MKKILLIAGGLLPAMAWAQQGNYVLQVKVAHMNPAAKAHLYYASGEKSVDDSAVLKNGVFEFKGVLAEPALASLQIDHEGAGLAHIQGGADMMSFFLDKGVTKIVTEDSLKRAAIPGSRLNKEAGEYKAFTKAAQDSMKTLFSIFFSAPQEKQQDKVFNDSLTALYDAQGEQLSTQRTTFAKAHAGSYMSLFAVKEMAEQEKGNLEKIEPAFKLLSPALQGSSLGKQLGGAIAKAKATAVGVMAPLFSQLDSSGKPVALESFRGKYVLLDFWASWCVPCRQENPNVVAAFNKYKDRNFTVVGISLDQPGKKDAWLEAVKKDGLDWPQLSDLQYWKNAVVLQYGIESIPQNYLIDPTGKIIAKGLRGEDLEKKLAEVLQ